MVSAINLKSVITSRAGTCTIPLVVTLFRSIADTIGIRYLLPNTLQQLTSTLSFRHTINFSLFLLALLFLVRLRSFLWMMLPWCSFYASNGENLMPIGSIQLKINRLILCR